MTILIDIEHDFTGFTGLLSNIKISINGKRRSGNLAIQGEIHFINNVVGQDLLKLDRGKGPYLKSGKDLNPIAAMLLKKLFNLRQLLTTTDNKRLAEIISFQPHTIQEDFQTDPGKQHQGKGADGKIEKQQAAVISGMGEKQQGGSQGKGDNKR